MRRPPQTLGVRSHEPREASRETTDSLRQAFTGAKRPALVAPFQPALHPILIHFAALALETVQLAGELTNGMMLYLATPARYRQMVTRMADAERTAHRAPTGLTVTSVIPAFRSEDLGAARRFVASAMARGAYTRFFQRSGFGTEAASV